MVRNSIQLLILLTMVLFNSCKGQDNEKHIYLAGWEVEFNGSEQCNSFIQTQAIDKETSYGEGTAIELVFKDNKLIKAFDIEEGHKTLRALKETEKDFKYQEVKPNQIYQIIKSEKGESYLGGQPPPDFKMPKFEFNAPFQYLGKISKSEEAFSWLPFDLHLVVPLYNYFGKLYIDYSNPLQPEIINIDELKKKDNADKNLEPNSEIVFKKTPIKLEKSKNYGDSYNHTGVPGWIQNPNIPIDPKSKKTMKFLCQLSSDIGVKAERTNVKAKTESMQHYYESLNFAGDGDIYIFFNPDTKMACFLIQNT